MRTSAMDDSLFRELSGAGCSGQAEPGEGPEGSSEGAFIPVTGVGMPHKQHFRACYKATHLPHPIPSSKRNNEATILLLSLVHNTTHLPSPLPQRAVEAGVMNTHNEGASEQRYSHSSCLVC